MTTRHTSTLTIAVRGPVVTAGLEAAAFGIDTSHIKGIDGTTPLLPESLVRGVVLDALKQMHGALQKAGSSMSAEIAAAIGWFGERSRNVNDPTSTGTLSPLRRKIRFGDLALKAGAHPRTITRIKIDETTGSAARGMLQIIESPLGIGEHGEFSGSVAFDLSASDAKIARRWILKALGMLPAIGAIKGAGFGRISGFSLSDPAPAPAPEVTAPKFVSGTQSGRRSVRYALRFDRPFLVSSQSISGNLFKGSETVPGAAIKGALADEFDRKGRLKDLARSLDRMVFRHAKPAASPTAVRPRAIPKSLYIRDDKTLVDALTSDPAAAGATGSYVEFGIDWKDSSNVAAKALTAHGITFQPTFDIRTRTAIDDKGTAADAQLFTGMAIAPGKHVWIGDIEQADVPDADFDAILAVLSQGVVALGKTRAGATLEWVPSIDRSATPIGLNVDREIWRIVLETDALLHGPGDVDRLPLDEHYRAYFTSALAARGGPKLNANQASIRFYAMQRWIGGYQAHRFPHFADRYYPQLLTTAGSVFELTLPKGCAPAMCEFARLGLPLPASVAAAERQYERSPFNPENGYGEVSIDDRDFTKPVKRG